MPLAFIALSTICCLTAGDGPASLYANSKVRPRPSRQGRHRERCFPSGDSPCLTTALPWHEGQCSTWMIITSLTRVDASPWLREGSRTTGLQHLPGVMHPQAWHGCCGGGRRPEERTRRPCGLRTTRPQEAQQGARGRFLPGIARAPWHHKDLFSEEEHNLW